MRRTFKARKKTISAEISLVLLSFSLMSAPAGAANFPESTEEILTEAESTEEMEPDILSELSTEYETEYETEWATEAATEDLTEEATETGNSKFSEVKETDTEVQSTEEDQEPFSWFKVSDFLIQFISGMCLFFIPYCIIIKRSKRK